METSPPHDANAPIPAVTASITAAVAPQNPSWVDEFLDFSLTRRGTHRRSVSDSVAFLEEAPTMLEECRSTGAPGSGSRHNSSCDFDRFDDEQFMSMFNDDISNAMAAPNSSSTPSSPSDHNSIMTRKNLHRLSNSRKILANRQSAQRSRVRKLQYISELERSVTSLQAEVSVLSPRVAYLDHQRLLLNVDNSALKQRIAALAQDKLFKDAHQEALRKEIERLRQVYQQQNLKMDKTNSCINPNK
ncbi:basic leucine zipper [Salix suchowensis]|nr:basic leucine zipper [Salix suchowensis]